MIQRRRGGVSLFRLLAILLLNGAATGADVRGTWTDGDPEKTLSDIHYLGAATRLADGRVIAAGGLDRKRLLSATTVAELYDPQARRWTATDSLKTPRWSLDAITLGNGKALFAGGASAFLPNAVLDTAELFDPHTNQFQLTRNKLSVARHSFGISLLKEGQVLITGGSAVGNQLNGSGVTAVDLYDPQTDQFRAVASLKSGRALHAQLTLRDGRVVVIGGAQTDAEIYDPALDRWTVSKGNLPHTLKDTKAFELFDGRIFIPGGQNTKDGVTSDTSWFFDVETGEFTSGPSLAGFNYAPSGVQIGCSDYSAFDLFPVEHKLHGRYLLIAGGEHDPLTGPDVELHSAMIFDAERNRFVNVGPMPFVHDDHTESLLSITPAGNPEVLLFGGNQSTGTSRFELDATSIPGL